MKLILVVGGGLIGIRHVAAVQAHPGCELVGLADPDMSILPDIPRYAAMEDVDCPVDGVIIATPTDLHASHGQQAAKRGWHMLIEKPVADKAQQMLLAGGHFWNAGIFLVQAGTLVQALRSHAPDILDICEQALIDRSELFGHQLLGPVGAQQPAGLDPRAYAGRL
mgnify:CR=1 FL=1